MSFEIFIDEKKHGIEIDEVLLNRYSTEMRELRDIIKALQAEPNRYVRWDLSPYTARSIAKMEGVRQRLSITKDPKSHSSIIRLKEEQE